MKTCPSQGTNPMGNIQMIISWNQIHLMWASDTHKHKGIGTVDKYTHIQAKKSNAGNTHQFTHVSKHSHAKCT